MPRVQRNQLQAKDIGRLSPKRGKLTRYLDGQNLYLIVKPSEAQIGQVRRSWILRYRSPLTGKQRDTGLGAFPSLSLAGARKKAQRLMAQIKEGLDPVEEKRQQRRATAAEEAKHHTFRECAERYISAHRLGWRNGKHAAQWRNTLDRYAAELMPMAVAEIDTPHVTQCLEPIWVTKTETASRVRQRIEAVLDYAAARGYRSKDNPARLRGHIDMLLGKPAKLKKVKARPALPYTELGGFMATLRGRNSLSAKALEFQILTASRPSESCGARWAEFDLNAAVWVIPPERMKANREHRVPLAAEAVALLRNLVQTSEYVFPGVKDRPLTTASPLAILKDIEPGVTAHGFRSSFRDWAADCTSYPSEIAEAALAHVLRNRTEAAYKRTDLFAKRRRLMDDWAQFCRQSE